MGPNQKSSPRIVCITDSIEFWLQVNRGEAKIRYYVNGDLIQEETKPALSTPWFFTQSIGGSSTAIRNIKITGQPEIPREVKLIPKDSLGGWASNFYGETIAQSVSDEEADEVSMPKTVVSESDWRVKDGIIHGKRLVSSGLDTSRYLQSRLYYSRPLADGEQIRYEFWNEVGANPVNVHPAVGRLAFLLDADGLKLHWMTVVNSKDEINYGLASDNVLVDESIRRGKVVLNDKSWNRVELSFKNNVVSIVLNGTLVCEYPLDRENSREFGLFYDKSASSVQVRDVVLKGDWPMSFTSEIASNLLAPSQPQTRSQRRAISRVIDEKFHAEYVEALLVETRDLPANERYEALARWILPNDDHVTLRLYGTFLSTNGIPDLAKINSDFAAPNKIDANERRRYADSGLIAPVLDLVKLGKECGRMNELKQQTEPKPDDDLLLKRSKLALRTLVHIANDQFAESSECLSLLQALFLTVPVNRPILEHWPEMVAGSVGLQHAELRSVTLPLLTLLVDQYRKQQPIDPVFGKNADRCCTRSLQITRGNRPLCARWRLFTKIAMDFLAREQS